MGIRRPLKRFRLESVQAGDGQRSVDNIDAMTSTAQPRMTPQGGPATFPPDYVKTDDEGRPRH
jgi:hypothetical protein